MLTDDFNTLTLVRLSRVVAVDLGSNLTDHFLVCTLDGEFGVFLDGYGDTCGHIDDARVGVTERDLEITAEAILKEFAEPLILAGKQLTISSSIGIAISDGNDNVSSIMKSADIALYQAKDAGRSNYKIFEEN